jgi:serine/threonine protein phosphatase PrpC
VKESVLGVAEDKPAKKKKPYYRKKYNKPKPVEVIIPEPDIVEHELYGDEEFIVLACDGLWDVMNPQQVRKFVNRYMSKNRNRTKGISEALVEESLRLGSTDNVSVVFIEFNSWKKPKRTY